MSGRLLDFHQFIGGSSNQIVVELFPSSQKEFTYDFGANISNYTFEADYQTLVLDEVTYDRISGNVNFANTSVVGYFANAEISNTFIDTNDLSTGIVRLTIPKNRYTGNIVPNARANVPCTVVGFSWTDTTSNVTDSHRWVILERYEPDVTPGNPRDEAGFIAL